MKLVQLVSSVVVCSSWLLMTPAMAVETMAYEESVKATDSRNLTKKSYRHARGGYPRLHGLELTEQQQQELKALHQTFRQQLTAQGSRQERGKQQQALQALLQADYFDETQARILLEQQQQSRLERQLAVLQWRHAVQQILTEEQLQQWQQKQPRQRSAKRASRWQRQGSSAL
ncbi:MAG: Spy/CpxP family protein refolding chaperone [Alkalimonas sp.]|nr:Spy/CpxP family protein refolding chaperone [Alkalimonas sp.]